MWMDKRNEFCDSTSAILASGATGAIIGNVIDTQAPNMGIGDATVGLGNVLADLGTGTPVYLVIQVDTTFVGATSTTTLSLRSDSTADLATSATTHVTTIAIPVATLIAGYQIVLPIPPDLAVERYVGMWEVVGTANVTAGAISAFLTTDARVWKAYADALNGLIA